MIRDDRVWTVRFRQATADRLRERAAAEGKTVQQIIVAAVEQVLGLAPEPAERSTTPGDLDLYHYGGGSDPR
jgi:hypothetical protein